MKPPSPSSRNSLGALLLALRRPFVKPRRPAKRLKVERAEQTFYIDYLRRGMRAFDVGANVGELTLLFSRFVGREGIVHSFEASRMVFQRLETIVRLANKRNVVLNNVALGDREGAATLHLYGEDHFGMHTLAERPPENYGPDVKSQGQEEVTMTTLDAYCKANGIETIDLLKVDVEGAELQVFRGAREMFARRAVACCVFEFGQTTFDMGNRPEEIRAFFDEHSYGIRNVVKGDPVFPGGQSAKTAKFSLHVATPR